MRHSLQDLKDRAPTELRQKPAVDLLQVCGNAHIGHRILRRKPHNKSLDCSRFDARSPERGRRTEEDLCQLSVKDGTSSGRPLRGVLRPCTCCCHCSPSLAMYFSMFDYTNSFFRRRKKWQLSGTRTEGRRVGK